MEKNILKAKTIYIFQLNKLSLFLTRKKIIFWLCRVKVTISFNFSLVTVFCSDSMKIFFIVQICNQCQPHRNRNIDGDKNCDNFSFSIYMFFFFRKLSGDYNTHSKPCEQVPNYRTLTPLDSPTIHSFQYQTLFVTMLHDYWSDQ